jgi:hypothetical protein
MLRKNSLSGGTVEKLGEGLNIATVSNLCDVSISSLEAGTNMKLN